MMIVIVGMRDEGCEFGVNSRFKCRALSATALNLSQLHPEIPICLVINSAPL